MFKRQRQDSDKGHDALTRDLADQAARLDALARRVDEIVVTINEERESRDRKIEQLDFEWTDMYDKFRRLHARIARRQQREDENEELTEPEGQRVDSSSPSEMAPAITNPLALQLLSRKGA